ncbi:hypothetical protein [Streptomyces canus]|uniref:hypothetical protein n=1 Tax=Streptomyces canus TaxID=58343 RepID=UPI002E2F481E|nr:hypothetical protein [Streptomyces canus]
MGTTRTSRLLVAAAASALLAFAGIPALASASDSAPAAAGTAPPSAVEDFGYPDAENILVAKGIKLIKGDGHVLLTDCASPDSQIKVMTVKDESVGRDGSYCFQATAKTGYLTLELPRVFYIETQDHPISADLTADGTTKTVAVAKDDFASVGEGTVGGAQSVLVEIRVTG